MNNNRKKTNYILVYELYGILDGYEKCMIIKTTLVYGFT